MIIDDAEKQSIFIQFFVIIGLSTFMKSAILVQYFILSNKNIYLIFIRNNILT